ncbi:unnamed protein product [Brugia pahangi]|uniref:THAP-type domain-containing protein n=1 Tax=Brugia pahangi TaxID=6280 RepID=A0A0N4TQE6_BRUPA|nr:unnamed protein product [Brugia pahangi]
MYSIKKPSNNKKRTPPFLEAIHTDRSMTCASRTPCLIASTQTSATTDSTRIPHLPPSIASSLRAISISNSQIQKRFRSHKVYSLSILWNHDKLLTCKGKYLRSIDHGSFCRKHCHNNTFSTLSSYSKKNVKLLMLKSMKPV